MSGPVDVLAVLADYSAQHGDPEDFEQVRAAVAELIEADKAFDVERKGYNPLYANRERLDRYEAAEKRRAAALARVQGVQP